MIRFVLPAFMALIAGCAVGPDYVRPTTEAPAAFAEQGPWKVAAPRDSAPKAQWWKVFADPALDALETQRGSYAADVGDRTYGVFNVLPRNGFERSRDADLLISGGNLGSGEAQLSLGDHSEQTAWYASVAGQRSNYGLATPVPQVLHDATNSGGTR